MTTLHIIDRSGDTQVDFEVKTIPQDVIDLFNDALSAGGMAYRVGLDPKDKEIIRDLGEIKEDTAKVVVRGPMAGG